MQSLKYAFRFNGRSFQLAIENELLQKPWMYQTLGNFAFLVLWFIPLALVIGLIGLRPIGLILVGLIVILLVLSWVVWGEITASRTCQVLDTLILKGDLPSESQSDWQVFKEYWADIFLFTLMLPGAHLLHTLRQSFSKTACKQPDWIEEFQLIQPVIILEDLDLAGAVARVEQMGEQHLLRVRAGFMKVDLIARFVEGLMLAAGIAAGLWISTKISDPIAASLGQRILSLGIGLLITWVITLFGFSFSTFSRTCYHTALYFWVRNVESARKSGDRSEAQPPEILAQVLGSAVVSKKE